MSVYEANPRRIKGGTDKILHIAGGGWMSGWVSGWMTRMTTAMTRLRDALLERRDWEGWEFGYMKAKV